MNDKYALFIRIFFAIAFGFILGHLQHASWDHKELEHCREMKKELKEDVAILYLEVGDLKGAVNRLRGVPKGGAVMKMSKRTLRALRGSIKKWENIREGEEEDWGSYNCPLCGLFITSFCKGCPVRHRTKEQLCKNSPYTSWLRHIESKHGKPYEVQCPTCKRLATAEIEFLKSLLP